VLCNGNGKKVLRISRKTISIKTYDIPKTIGECGIL
jgi:hypothetical protein